MKTDEEIIQAAEETIQKMDNILQEAESNLAESDRLFQKLGIDRDTPQRILESNQFSAAERAKARQEIAEFEEELRRDSEEAVRHFKQQNAADAPTRRVPLNRIRI